MIYGIVYNSFSSFPSTDSEVDLASPPHPIHLHGYKFNVLKSGTSDDILCSDDKCATMEWADESWYGGNIPGLNLANPVVKDTVPVYGGSYVVVRFRANNPGMYTTYTYIIIPMYLLDYVYY